jgi:predicted small secreted protein
LPDYQMDRTVSALLSYAQRKIEQDSNYKDWQKKKENEGEKSKTSPYLKSRPVHPGCQLSGHLMVNRVPGNFHIEARSKHHNLNAGMTNLTHRVNHLSFGETMEEKNRKQKRILKQVPEEHKQFVPLDGRLFRTSSFHQSHHHHIKVVSTHFDMTGNKDPFHSMVSYQFLEQSQIVHYHVDDVPEARFAYDISPMSVVVEKQSRKWYDYLTSVSAIVGGTFTTLGLIDAFFYNVFTAKKID